MSDSDSSDSDYSGSDEAQSLQYLAMLQAVLGSVGYQFDHGNQSVVNIAPKKPSSVKTFSLIAEIRS